MIATATRAKATIGNLTSAVVAHEYIHSYILIYLPTDLRTCLLAIATVCSRFLCCVVFLASLFHPQAGGLQKDCHGGTRLEVRGSCKPSVTETYKDQGT